MFRLRHFVVTALLCTITASAALAQVPGLPEQFEGYGATTTGGAGGDVYHVTSLGDSGPGTLRDGVVNRSGPRRIVFDVAGTISLPSDLVVNRPFLTIDGSTAPAPGITIAQTAIQHEFIIGGTHDIVVRHLRFHGQYTPGGPSGNPTGTIVIDGDTGPDRVARNIVLDHIVSRNSADGGPDIWGEVQDVTIQWSFFFYSLHPTTVSHYPSPFQTRQRISMHHNVYAKNGERNPQMRADVRNFDYRNNIVYDWGYFGGGGYGIRVKNASGEPKVNANFINNYFLPGTPQKAWALVYGENAGPDSEDGSPSSTPAQGTVITTSNMGQLYVAGNVLPSENREHYSTVAQPLAVAAVTTWAASELKARVLPDVGMRYRTADEQAILDELGSRMTGGGGTQPTPPAPPTNVRVIR